MNEQKLPASDANENFSQYLSFRFYRSNLDHLKDKTRDSINNFLKTISEIEDEFMSILHTQQRGDLTPYDFDFDTVAYMEENY